MGSLVLSGGTCINFAVKEAGGRVDAHVWCAQRLGKMTWFIAMVAGLVVGWAMCSTTSVWLGPATRASGRGLLSLGRFSVLFHGRDRFSVTLLH